MSSLIISIDTANLMVTLELNFQSGQAIAMVETIPVQRDTASDQATR